jgi:hypothetical protein
MLEPYGKNMDALIANYKAEIALLKEQNLELQHTRARLEMERHHLQMLVNGLQGMPVQEAA